MDIIEKFYNETPYPDVATFLGPAPEYKMDLAVPKHINYDNKYICVAGCGTCQAFMVGNQLPNARIIGCDVSKTSLEITERLLKKFDIKNVTLIHSRFEDIKQTGFSLVLASGVMHHTEDRILFMNKSYDILEYDGIFRGMVYNIDGRKGIRELNNFFVNNNFTVSDVIKYFEKNPNEFFNSQNKVHNEIKDTWLNPRFHEYNVESLDEEFNMSKWVNSKRAFQVIPTKTQIYFEFRK